MNAGVFRGHNLMVDLPQNNHSQGGSWREAQRAEMTEFLRESRADIVAGRTQPALRALEHLAKKHGLRRKRK